MRLQDLRPSAGINVLNLRRLVEGHGWDAVLPGALCDDILLALARDLSFVEGCLTGEAADLGRRDPSSLASVIYVVSSLLMHHLEEKGDVDRITIPLRGMAKSVQVYHWAVEREIAARIVGVGAGAPAAFLLDGMWECVVGRAD